MDRTATLVRWLLAVTLLAAANIVCAQEQYPKPIIHTPTDHPAARVLILSVDGLHAVDLANWIATHPHSALAELAVRGDTYTNAHTPMADPAAGLLALTTGGTPISTGIVSSDGYDRTLSPPGSECKTAGAALTLDANFKHPLDPRNHCAPLQPHQLLRVNTIFEVVHEKIGPTAWAGEDPATADLLRGRSGKGLTEACAFDPATPATGDRARTAAILHWIDAKDCTGASDSPVPVLFGMSYVSLAAAQSAPGKGYIDAMGTPSGGLAQAFESLDATIGRIVAELKAKSLYDSTWIIVTSPYGQSPMDQRRRRHIPIAQVKAVVDAVQPGLCAHITGGDAALIWLTDSTRAPAVVKALGDAASAIGLAEIVSGARLALTFNSPQQDPRMPDIILQPVFGVLWAPASDTALASHGGTLDEDTHVALLVSGPQFTGRSDPTYVPTTQLGPLLLRALGMEKFDLDALHKEHSPALPGVF